MRFFRRAYAIGIVGAFLFLNGFMRMRKPIETKSSCNEPPIGTIFQNIKKTRNENGIEITDNSQCWITPLQSKSNSKSSIQNHRYIVLVIDALRSDFVLSPSLEVKNLNHPSQVYVGNMPIIAEMKTKDPLNCHLFEFLADHPTATRQRLTSINGGSLPEFVQMFGSFDNDADLIDNIPFQFVNSGKYEKFNFLGDDSWTNLYPIIAENKKTKKFSNDRVIVNGLHSFHVFDLHTVDQAIQKDLFPLMEREDYNVIAGHFIGLDHCGHFHTPSHPNCAIKLNEMNKVIEEVIKRMKDNDMLIIYGDHGMTNEGAHGGASQKEISSILFTYLKRKEKIFKNQKLILDEYNNFWNPWFKELRGEKRPSNEKNGEKIAIQDTYKIFCANRKEVGIPYCDPSILNGSVSQIKLASTMALHAGIPIPFSNVGSIIPDLFVDWSIYDDDDISNHHESSSIKDNRIDNDQIQRIRLKILKNLIECIRMNAHQVMRYLEIVHKFHLVKDLKEELESFDKIIKSHQRMMENRENHDQLTVKELMNLFESFNGWLDRSLNLCKSVWNTFNYGRIWSGLMLALLALGYILNRSFKIGVVLDCIVFVFIVLLGSGLSSTSLSVFEDVIVKFLLNSTLILVLIAKGIKEGKLIIPLLLLVRISKWFGSCREEQLPECMIFSHRTILDAPILLYGSLIGIGIATITGLIWLWKIKGKSIFFDRKLLLTLSFLLSLLNIFYNWFKDKLSIDDDTALYFARLTLVINLGTWIIERYFYGRGRVESESGEGRGIPELPLAFLISMVLRPFGAIYAIFIAIPSLQLLRHLSHLFTNLQLAWIFYLFGMLFFFGMGHQSVITTIQWEAAFITLRTTNYWIAAIFLFLNTFGGPILAWSCMRDIAGHRGIDQRKSSQYLLLMLLGYFLYAAWTIPSFLLYHLWTWKIFTPRLLLQILLLFIGSSILLP